MKFPLRETQPSENIENKVSSFFHTKFGKFHHTVVDVRFKRKDDSFTEPVRMYFDTGASLSLIPATLFDELGIEGFVTHEMSGVVQKKECKLEVKLARVEVFLEDIAENRTKPFNIWIAGAETDNVHLLFGMKDFLDKFKVAIDPKEKMLIIEDD